MSDGRVVLVSDGKCCPSESPQRFLEGANQSQICRVTSPTRSTSDKEPWKERNSTQVAGRDSRFLFRPSSAELQQCHHIVYAG